MPFLGMRGSGDWATGQRPESYRQSLLYLYPNGRAPLTAMMSMMKELGISDPTRNWFTKTLNEQASTVTAATVYSDASLSTTVASGSANDIVYQKMAAADVVNYRVGHQVRLARTSNNTECVAEVLDRVVNGSSSYLQLRLINAATSPLLSNVNRVWVVGNINAEKGLTPDSWKTDPTPYSNYTQIFRTSVSMSETARATDLRTGDPWKEDRREALEYHGIEMEKAFFWGAKSLTTASNGQIKRTLDGIIPFVRTNASGNIFDYVNDSSYSGQSWLQGGSKWLNEKLEQIYRFNDGEVMAFCGSGAVLGINRLAEDSGFIQLTPESKSYGIQVVNWSVPFGNGKLALKTHPLFSFESSTRNMMVVFNPRNLVYCYLNGNGVNRDTHLVKDVQIPGTDGKTDEWVTECTLEIHHPTSFGVFYGLNQDNAV